MRAGPRCRLYVKSLHLWPADHTSGGTLAEALDQQGAVVAAANLEIGHRLDEVRQARVAEVARGEARHRLGALAELRQRRITLLVALRGLVGRAEDLEQLLVDR